MSMLTGLWSRFSRKSRPEAEDKSAAWVKLLVKLCAQIEEVGRKSDLIIGELREDRHAGERAAAKAYQECMNRLLELSLVKSGKDELAGKFRAFASRDQAPKGIAGAMGLPDLDPPPGNDGGEEEWPPKDCVVMKLKG